MAQLSPLTTSSAAILHGSMPPERIRIALLNNMPSAAFEATTKQFGRLLRQAAPELDLAIDVFIYPERAQSDQTVSAPTTKMMMSQPFDGLIVTGSEPLYDNIEDEAYWPSFVDVADWADVNTHASIWSCLAAHAAVLKACGLRRRRLDRKRSGLYACDVLSNHRLVRGAGRSVFTPHSRFNELAARELQDNGYDILTCSPQAGVDAFIRDGQSLALHLQGHPEYESRTLLLEYRRDVRRWLLGQSPAAPPTPENYFAPGAMARIDEIIAASHRSIDQDEVDRLLALLAAPDAAKWRSWTLTLLRNWLGVIVDKKTLCDTRLSAWSAR